MKRVTLLGFIGILFAAGMADDTADIEIYTDYVVGLWRIDGTASINPVATAQKKSFNNSISVNMQPGSWVKIAHTWELQRVKDIAYLEFWIRGDNVGGQNFTITACINWQERGPVQLTNFTSVAPRSWKRVRIPLSRFNAQPNEDIVWFKFESTSGTGPFFIDDIKLVKPPLPGTANVSVNTSNVLRTLNKELFGLGTFTWDWEMNTQQTKDLMVEAGIRFMNFPGGSSAEEYDWANNRSRLNGATGYVDTLTYLQVAESIGAEKMITANYGSGTPEEARDWVDFANVQHNGNVIYWSIGNESYAGGYDIRPEPYKHDAETYAQFVRDCILLMKAVDPRIKIGIVGTLAENQYAQRTTVVNPRTGQQANGWSAVVLAKLKEYGTLPDYFDLHVYALAPGTETDSATLQNANRVNLYLSSVRPMLVDYLGAAGADLPVHVTESNSVWMPVGRQSTSMTTALYYADYWGECAKANLGSTVWWNLHNPAQVDGNNHASLYGRRNFGDFGLLSMGRPEGVAPPANAKYPVFYAFKQVSTFAAAGDELIEATSDNELLKVYASKNPITGRVKLLVINKAKKRDYSANITVSGFDPPTRATLKKYTMQQENSDRDIVVSNVSTSRRVRYGVTSVRFSFPRYSITVVEF